MKIILIGAVACASIGTANAQYSSISFNGSGTGSGYSYGVDYWTWEYVDYVKIDDGSVLSSFDMKFDHGVPTLGISNAWITSQDGLTHVSGGVSAFMPDPYNWISFSGNGSSGSAEIFEWRAMSNGAFRASFSYTRQPGGLYTVIAGTNYWYQAGDGEWVMSASWEMHDVAITFVGTPLPEPMGWALLIGGFGVSGMTLRRRRVRFALA